MAALIDADRAALWADFMRLCSTNKETFGAVTKADIRAAVDAADTWADSNAASFNAAIPLPARTAFTARQKAMLLMFIIRRRYEIS